MSDPIAESTNDAPERESLGAALALAFGLLLLVGAVYSIVSLREPRGLDGDAELAEWFQVEEKPFDYQVIEASTLPGGRRLVVLGSPSESRIDAIEREADETTEAEAIAAGTWSPDEEKGEWGGGGRHGGGRRGGSRGRRGRGGGGHGHGGGFGGGPGPFAKVTEGEPGTAPVEVAFVRYRKSSTQRVIDSQFNKLRFQDVTQIWDDEASVPVDSGWVEWERYQANYVRLRHFKKVAGKPVFHDTLRVNLSVGGECQVAYLRWPRGMPGNLESAEQVLASMGPRDS